ncbi:PAS domain-containing sensor histidine kinase [Arenibacter sp. F26102]|uniref:sensor histidine kinase n=1 Tax=Arenibacter sp. F26102 TaxID=2926416 RepID=UPI001FF2A9DF|nr:PAS domain-containing sensor histidine kinase [Arenibacter sp. F26102]MCK0146074.1 PAS domain-containing sensor histidine kinase [Arenibacter sp. F26102]
MDSSKRIGNELRTKAEARAKRTRLFNKDFSMEKARTLLYELEVHQIELEMQNTELRETQAHLEKVKDEYTDLFDFAPVGYLILDEKGTILNINLTGCNLLGQNRARIKGKPFSAYLSREESNAFYLRLKEAFKTGTLPAFDLQLNHKTSVTALSVLVQGVVTTNEHSECSQCRVSLQDVTDLRKAEKLLEEKARIQRYLDMAPIVFLLLDPGHNVKMINQKGCDLLGYNRLHVQGKNWFQNFSPPLDEKGITTNADLHYKKLLLEPYCEYYIVRKNGERRLIAWSNSSLLDKKGNIIGTIIAGDDITSRKKVDDGKQAYLMELEKTVKLRTKAWKTLKAEKKTYQMNSRFVLRASRELHRELTSLTASVNLVEKYYGPGQHTKQLPYIFKVRSGVIRLGLMFDNFLLMDRLERGKVKVHMTVFDLEKFVNGINKKLEGLLQNDLEINYRHHGNVKVLSDKKILEKVFTNLIDNAIKFSDLDINVKTMANNGLLIASFKDRGIGIPKEEQQYVFNKYYKAKNTDKTKGTGLGLAVAKQCVELLNGTLEFASNLKTGSTFTVVLPQVRP